MPAQLAQQSADAVRELLAEAAAANTTRSYASALCYGAGWHATRYGIELALPVPEETVLQFVVDHVQRRSIEGELAWELPPAVDQALVAAGLKAILGLGPSPWFATGWRCCRPRTGSSNRPTPVSNRRSELCSAVPPELPSSVASGRARKPRSRWPSWKQCSPPATTAWKACAIAAADLRRIGDNGFIYRLEHSKTQQAGVTASSTPDKPVLDRAALALEDWLEASGITEGAIFRRLWKRRVGPALSPAAVGEVVQRQVHMAGLEGDFEGHSLRSGFVTEASRQGVSLPAIMQLTEHRAVSSVIGYFQAGGATANPLLAC